MTSLNSEDKVKGEHSYVTACAAQAQIALIHLRRVWAREGEPGDLSVWSNVSDPLEVWADLQGALTAGIVLSRLLKPLGVHPRHSLTKKQAQASSNARGDRLRSLLDIPDNSVLLTIRAVRDPVEHIDERLDRAVENDSVASISDLYIAYMMYHTDRLNDSVESAPTPLHANMRTFLPVTGHILYGAERFDLFAYEEALLKLLSAVPAARESIDETRPESGRRSLGSSQPSFINPVYIDERRSVLANMRKARDVPGLRSTKVDDPQSVMFVITPPVAVAD
ncbi:hypothetical protein [Microbacterium sp. MMO-113]|uniref:hypothetical protein n=1 Tax=Microbacterium sp. MMO-113 TaxID=3081273 RepID=UPI003017EEAE